MNEPEYRCASGYERAFAAVPGCLVKWVEYFGYYQGRLLAKVWYEGQTLYVHDWYGSCSGCDAFEGEFGYSTSETSEALAAFGYPYIASALPLDNIISALEAECSEWDDDLKAMLAKLYVERGAEGSTPCVS